MDAAIADIGDKAELACKMQEIYNCAIANNGPLLKSVQNIVNAVSCFIHSSHTPSYEKDVKKFIEDHFYSSIENISEKYDKQDGVSEERKAREYQMQVFLAFEMESLFPSADVSQCVKNVTSYSRAMSFLCGTSALHKLQDVLKENYSKNLRHILSEIGDELNLPLFEEPSSPSSSVDFPSSDTVSEIEFQHTSSISTRSNSSASSFKEYKKCVQNRNDISKDSQKQQIVVPGIFLRNSRRVKMNHSFSSCSQPGHNQQETNRRKLNTISTSGSQNAYHLSQNQNRHTPVKISQHNENLSQKNRLPLTPKGQHVLKTRFVAETPSPKQKRSAMQRRKYAASKYSMTSVTEVAESPKGLQNCKDETSLHLLNSLNSPKNHSKQITDHSPKAISRSFAERTPDSKRRLSLKLFSKILSSPTAHSGAKRCSKRLFSQTSPHPNRVPRKKLKFIEEVNGVPEENDSREAFPELFSKNIHSVKDNLEENDRKYSLNEDSLHLSSGSTEHIKLDTSPPNDASPNMSISDRLKENVRHLQSKLTPPGKWNNHDIKNKRKLKCPTPLSLLHLTTSPIISKPRIKKFTPN